MQAEDPIPLLQNLQRPINCLTDQDRNIRKQGLAALSAELSKTSKQIQAKILNSTNLGKNLLHTLSDLI